MVVGMIAGGLKHHVFKAALFRPHRVYPHLPVIRKLLGLQWLHVYVFKTSIQCRACFGASVATNTFNFVVFDQFLSDGYVLLHDLLVIEHNGQEKITCYYFDIWMALELKQSSNLHAPYPTILALFTIKQFPST